jgi:BA14K-like protein
VVGVFAGRMSAWVFPVANPDLAALKASLEKAPPQLAIKTQVPARAREVRPEERDRPTLALSPPATETEQPATTQNGPTTNEASPSSRRAVEEPETKKSPREAVLVNPDWITSRPAPEELELNRSARYQTNSGGIAECERRYSSFRASDGTYQPFGRSGREVCPFLR